MSAPIRFRTERHERVASTNDLARAAAERGEPEGLWVLAREQTAGRGRQGRLWSSPPGNFYGSLLLRPRRPLAEVATLSLVAALAVAEAVERLARGRVRPAVKWPNDVLVDRAKLAGILPEAIVSGEGSCAALVLGIGVNLAHHPEGLGRPTVSLAALDLPPASPEAFLAALEPVLAERYALWQERGFAALRPLWLARAAGLGERVRLEAGGLVHEGVLVEVGADGGILLESPAGERRRFTAGELVLAAGEPAAAFAPAAEASSAARGRL
ncbi:MAG: biotin--[acetyl-CoA-carboxylase] ligase [Geminicoccaceae bacterium]|nr:biotin--[acetyl-CoA-carboxylase] ligase [Geminicoccaceae bacterium]MDW8370701.1 biotin--[acetyl-CoA-carboxylase] ligase [Geminicoccaceae bacterium]